jgi:hypothetical protein
MVLPKVRSWGWRVAVPVCLGVVLLVGCPGPGNVATITVTGRVVANDGVPLAGVRVFAQGELVVTDDDGDFVLDGITVPYTLMVGSLGSEPWAHVYEGLTAASLVLAPLTPEPPLVGGLVRGRVWNGGTLPADQRVVVGVEGRAFDVFGLGQAPGGDTEYAAQAFWRGSVNAPVRLHALRMQVEADGRPIDFLGYDASVETTLVNGVVVEADVLPWGPIGNSRFLGSIIPAGGGVLNVTAFAVRLSDAFFLPLFWTMPGLGAVEFAVPDVATGSGAVLVYATAAFPEGSTNLWVTLPVMQEFELRLPAPPLALEPAAGASGVDDRTVFRATGGPSGGRVFRWEPTGATGGPIVALSTTRDAVTLPDLGALGLAFVRGGTYLWATGVVEAGDLASAAEIPPAGLLWLFGSPGMPERVVVAWSKERSVTLAP